MQPLDPPFSLDFTVFAESLSQTPTLSDFLALRFQRDSADTRAQWFTQGRVLLDGQPAAPEQPLLADQQVSLQLPGHCEGAVDLRWRMVWQNDDLMAVYKPPLLPVSRTTRNLYNTLIQLVRRQTPWYDAHLLHRLDTETDGLILLAKHKAADRHWKPRLDTLMVRKIYHAQVYGQPDWKENVIECELAGRSDSPIRCQSHVVQADDADYIKPRHSRTALRNLGPVAVEAVEQPCSLIECELSTGRKHQIRAHLAHLGHPVVGDKIYAHQGHFYLKRLQQPLEDEDFRQLGGRWHRLTSMAMALQLEAEGEPVWVSLDRQGSFE